MQHTLQLSPATAAICGKALARFFAGDGNRLV